MSNPQAELVEIFAAARANRVQRELAAQQNGDLGCAKTEATTALVNSPAKETPTNANQFYQILS
jgi:hypothetical protein